LTLSFFIGRTGWTRSFFLACNGEKRLDQVLSVQPVKKNSSSTKCEMIIIASCLISAQPLPAYCPAIDDNEISSCQVVIWLHSFIKPDLFDNNVPFNNTTLIYLISLIWKLGLRLGLDLELHYFCIFSQRITKTSTLSSANFMLGHILL